jgi:PAS domain S-box-containing protein
MSLRPFLVAGAIVAVAVIAREALDLTLPATPPFITLYPAVALAALLCGPWAGAASGLAGLVAAIFLWIPPKLSLGIPNLTNCVSIALFVAASSVVLWTAAVLRARLIAATVAKHATDLGLAAGGVGTWEINLRSRRITASDVAYALHGLSDRHGHTTAEDWLRGVLPEDAAAARAALQAAIVGGTIATYTYRVLVPGESPRWISARGRSVSSGGEQRLLCALVDITEQARVQDELRRERERLRLALEAGKLAVWDYSPETGEVTFDQPYAAMMGLDPTLRSVTRAQIGERIHPEDLPRVAAEHAAAMAKGSAYHIEYRIIRPSGDIRWLSSQGILIRSDVSRDQERMIGIIQDITERKRREDDLRALAAMRELLVREADHRIKNSLQLVISLLTVQLRGISDPAAVDALRGAIARVSAIAASHLALQGSEDLRTLDLGVTLKELCGHFAELHPGITIVCRAAEALMLDADRAIPLGLAVSEVLTNALRHAFRGRAGGGVVVESSHDQSELVVRISDDGVGMEPDSGSTGLGSRIIRSLAQRLAATILVESTPQAGTVVTLRLPLVLEEPAQRAMA